MRSTSFAAGLALAAVAFVVLIGAEPSPGTAEICQPGYARSHRMPLSESQAIKRELMRQQHPGEFIGNYELDHIRPLCLGGTNAHSNLMLQPWPEALAKDKEEWAVCRAVCAGTMTLEEGIRQMEAWRP